MKLDPANHILKATDSIEYIAVLIEPDTLYLPSNLNIKSIKTNGKKIKYEIKADSSGYNSITIFPEKNASIYSISYEGEIFFALQGRNLNQGHDFSRGMISDSPGEGIFLPSGSWYPMHEDEELSFYSVIATCLKEFSLITSGNESKLAKGSNNVYSWKTELPTDGLTLCGNRFIVRERHIGEKRLAVYLLPEEAKLADTYLDAMEDIYNKYYPLLGTYPFSSFSMVENFFASGYGMPNYTLLAKDIVKMPFIITDPGSLAHEFCHNWWGNSVMVKPGTGNWCEALTAFSSNYYWNELTGDREKQIDYRKNAIFSINQLAPEKNYPLADFRYQRNDDDAVIGYQKGSMLFYELYNLTGKEAFFNSLRQVIGKFLGKYATWNDFEVALTKNSPDNTENIHKLCEETLNRLDLPQIKISSVTHSAHNWVINLKQENPVFAMRVPVHVEMDDNTEKLNIPIKNVSASYSFTPWGKINKITVDPEYQILRAISDNEMPYNLNRVMSANPLIILPTKGESLDRLQMLIMMLKQSDYQFTSLPADSVTEEDLKNRNLFILGKYNDNRIFSSLPLSIQHLYIIHPESFEANGKLYNNPLASLLISDVNCYNHEKLMTLYIWNDDSAVPSFRKMFHYQNQSWQVFDLSKEANKPIDSGDLSPSSNSDLVWKAK